MKLLYQGCTYLYFIINLLNNVVSNWLLPNTGSCCSAFWVIGRDGESRRKPLKSVFTCFCTSEQFASVWLDNATSLNCAAGSCPDDNCMLTIMFSVAGTQRIEISAPRHRIDKNAGLARPPQPPSASPVSTVLSCSSLMMWRLRRSRGQSCCKHSDREWVDRDTQLTVWRSMARVVQETLALMTLWWPCFGYQKAKCLVRQWGTQLILGVYAKIPHNISMFAVCLLCMNRKLRYTVHNWRDTFRLTSQREPGYKITSPRRVSAVQKELYIIYG